MHSAERNSVALVWMAVSRLTPCPRNVRRHSKKQIRQIARSIEVAGFLAPIVVDENGVVLAGHARLEAARLCGMSSVPVIRASALTEAQKRVFMLADNRLAQNAGLDRAALLIELRDLQDILQPLDLDISVTGFELPEILELETDLGAPAADPGDSIPAAPKTLVTRRGDLWRLGPHAVLCGDALSSTDVLRVMGSARARVIFTDPPYNVRIAGHVQGKGAQVHPEFAFASGEMDRGQYTGFLGAALRNLTQIAVDGAVAYIFMDWRHIDELSAAARAERLTQLNLVVWNKTSPGQGSFYRSQHELIFVFRIGEVAPLNAFGLGKHGRTRSNVWTYPGGNSFHAGRAEEAAMHPTVKPLALVADALKDCSMSGDHVLDVFGGSGTTLMAAEKVGRIAHLVEYEPRYIDVTIKRWQQHTNLEAILEGDGRSWEEIAAARAAKSPPSPSTPGDSDPDNPPKAHGLQQRETSLRTRRKRA